MTRAARRAHDEHRRGLRAQGVPPDFIIRHLVAIRTAGLRAALEVERLHSDELQESLTKANDEIECLRREVARARGSPFAHLAGVRHGRKPLGADEFAAIRSSSISRADLAARYGCSDVTIRQIQRGTYPGKEFRRLLAESGLGAERSGPHRGPGARVRGGGSGNRPEPPIGGP